MSCLVDLEVLEEKGFHFRKDEQVGYSEVRMRADGRCNLGR